MAPAVLLRSVVALSGRFPVLAGADLVADAGDVVVLTGPNGAGKTSILRVCAGLLPVSDGEALVLGEDLRRDRRAVRRRVGMLGHANGLYDDLTVADNVRFAVRAAGGRASAADEAMERLGLSGRLRGLTASRLSAGQRRRVALAALVARSPELWLLDEPHAGLDLDGRRLLDAMVLEAVAGGATVLVASHGSAAPDGLPVRNVEVSGGRTVEAALVA